MKGQDLIRKAPQAAAARLCGVDPRTLRRWHLEPNAPPRNTDGSYDLRALAEWRFRRRHADNFADQRQRLAAAQAEKIEAENLARRDYLVALPEVQRVVGEHNAAARERFLALPAEVAPQIVGVTSAPIVVDILRRAIYRELAAQADWLPRDCE